eukprot:129678_1
MNIPAQAAYILLILCNKCHANVIFSPITNEIQLPSQLNDSLSFPTTSAVTEYTDPIDNKRYYYLTTNDWNSITIFDIYNNNLTQYYNKQNKELSDSLPYIISTNESPNNQGGINVCTSTISHNIIQCLYDYKQMISTCQIYINSLNQWTSKIIFQQDNTVYPSSAASTICLDDDNILIIYHNNNQLRYSLLKIDENKIIFIEKDKILNIPQN